ncbi:hypothetical protein HUJ04_001164 [Dendroctonus ponderosae]|nr:hypothetical protein HUJ04_001164 [Dendroctonus ponderosae]
MVTVCGRKFANTREKLLLAAKENKPPLGAAESLFSKTKGQNAPTEAGASSGTFIPNSTFKSLKNSAKEQKSAIATVGQSAPIKRSSILSGTETLEELKQMRDLLRKTSYVPKQPPSRRPTFEKIKSAIEQEKRVLMDERQALEMVKEELQLVDTSTSTTTAVKLRRTKKKKPSKRESPNKRKMGGKVKMKLGKVDVEIQCSIGKAA